MPSRWAKTGTRASACTRADQALAAARHDHVDELGHRQHLADRGAVARRHELDRGLGQAGGAQARRRRQAWIAREEWKLSEPPRRITALPAFRQSAPASAVTLGRLSKITPITPIGVRTRRMCRPDGTSHSASTVPDRIGLRGDRAQPLDHAARRAPSSSVSRSSIARDRPLRLGGRHVLGVGVQDRLRARARSRRRRRCSAASFCARSRRVGEVLRGGARVALRADVLHQRARRRALRPSQHVPSEHHVVAVDQRRAALVAEDRLGDPVRPVARDEPRLLGSRSRPGPGRATAPSGASDRRRDRRGRSRPRRAVTPAGSSDLPRAERRRPRRRRPRLARAASSPAIQRLRAALRVAVGHEPGAARAVVERASAAVDRRPSVIAMAQPAPRRDPGRHQLGLHAALGQRRAAARRPSPRSRA